MSRPVRARRGMLLLLLLHLRLVIPPRCCCVSATVGELKRAAPQCAVVTANATSVLVTFPHGANVRTAAAASAAAAVHNLYATLHATGAQWTSFWHASQTHAGGSTATVAAPLFETPVFVRAGSILPLRAAGPALCHSDATEVP